MGRNLLLNSSLLDRIHSFSNDPVPPKGKGLGRFHFALHTVGRRLGVPHTPDRSVSFDLLPHLSS